MKKLYTAVKSRYYKKLQNEGFTGDFEEWWGRQLDERCEDNLKISLCLEEELKNRLSPFCLLDLVVQVNVWRNKAIGYPFTRIEDIFDTARTKPEQMFRPKHIEDSFYRLMSLSRSGALSNEFANTLAAKGVKAIDLDDFQDCFDNSEYLKTLESGEYDIGWLRAVNGKSCEYPPDDFVDFLPFSLSMLHLSEYYQIDTHKHWKESMRVVVGDTISDFCLYYCLSRMHSNVYWMPDIHLRSAHRYMADRIRNPNNDTDMAENEKIVINLVNMYYSVIYRELDRKLELMSYSLTKRQMVYRKKWVFEMRWVGGDDVLKRTIITEKESINIDCIVEIIEENNHFNQQDMMFQEGKSLGRLITPKPKNFYPVNASNHRWITGVNIGNFYPPVLPSLENIVFEHMSSAHEKRVIRGELAYLSPNIAYFGGDIDTVTISPRLYLPSCEEIFSKYFDYSGYKVKLSDKGGYLKDAIERFGSLESLARFFRKKKNRDLMDQFLVNKSRNNDSEIIYINTDKRAYLSFAAFSRMLDSEEETVQLMDEFIAKEIVYRGLIFKCSRCRLLSWYNVSDVGRQFTCNRCGLAQEYYHSHWRSPTEPRWYYRLAETVFLFYSHNSHITALALDKLRQEHPDKFHFISESDIVDGYGRQREIDVLAIVDGQIILGECKNTAPKAEDIKKYCSLFNKLKIVPAQFLLATTCDGISNNVNAELGKLDNYRVFLKRDLFED